MSIAQRVRLSLVGLAFGLLIHFASVGAIAWAEGVLWPRDSSFRSLTATAGWYLNGALIAPLFWAAFLPHIVFRVRTIGWKSLNLPAVIAGAAAINSIFFLMMLTDQQSSFNSYVNGGFWETPTFTLLPNALQSTILDIGLFAYVGLQFMTIFSQRPTNDDAATSAATDDLARASWLASAAALAHLGAVTLDFVGRNTLSAGPILLAFLCGAMVEVWLTWGVHRVRQLRRATVT